MLVNLTSDGSGTSGLGTTGLGGQTVVLSGKVYRLAAANSITTPISLGNVHVGGTFGTSALSINNTATADGYSEGLDAAFGSLTGAASTNGGSISLLAAGGADSTSMTVGLGGAQGTAGSISGSVLVNLTSDGSGTSGLGTTGLSGQTVVLSGKVYRLAAANITSGTLIELGTIITGATFGTQTVSIQNTAVADSYSEMLNAGFSGTTGGATASGSFNLLSPGATSSALTVGLTYSGTGSQSGTATIALVSDGTGTSGLGTTALDSQTISVSGTVLGHAGPALSVVSGDSQTVIVGASGITAGLSLANGYTGQTGLAALDVNSLGAGVSGLTGYKVVSSARPSLTRRRSTPASWARTSRTSRSTPATIIRWPEPRWPTITLPA